MAIKASDVAKLRKTTGAGMMDCKKALTEADGDFDAAVENIRKKGQAVANKRADREATEGAIISIVAEDGKKGGIITLNCETDFVAKNESFVALATSILDSAIAAGAKDVDAVNECIVEGKAVKDLIIEQIGVMGEKIDIAKYALLEDEAVVAYIHPGNKLATLVAFNQAGFDVQVGRDVAMQTAAMAPVAVNRDSVPQDVIDKELDIAKELARNEGKPENMLDKIAQGRLNKFFKESTLLDQAFVKDNKMSIAQYLNSASKGLTANDFKRFSLD